MTAGEAFSDGNRLFRDDLYWAALLRYEEAADSGMDTPPLHYNMGVTHYRARQYRRAADAFEKAARSRELEVLAHYNLGLTARADRDPATALRWLRRARDQERSRKISRLADEAIELIRQDEMLRRAALQQDAVVEEAVEEPVRELERDPRPFSEFEFFARAGTVRDGDILRGILRAEGTHLYIPVPTTQHGIQA